MSKHSAGGKARAAKLTPEQRSQIAREAAHRRWHKDEGEMAPPAAVGTSFVYGLGAKDSPLKIGMSTEVGFRRQALQAATHLELVLWFALPVALEHARAAEQTAHQLLAHSRLRGEWFNTTPEDAERAVREAIDRVQLGMTDDLQPWPESVMLKLPAKLRAVVDAYAAERSVSAHEAILALVDKGLAKITTPAPRAPDAKAVLAEAEKAAAHLAKPKPKPQRSRWSLKGVPLGPVPRPPGSMLIDKSKRRR